MAHRSADIDLVYLVSDVITALGGACKHSPRLYRELKVSLAIMALEIHNTDIRMALFERPKLQRAFENLAKALDGAFRKDFVKAKYQHLKAEETQPLSLSKWWPWLFTSWADSSKESMQNWTQTPYSYLGMVCELFQSSLPRELRVRELLVDDYRVIRDLTRLVNELVEQLDRGQFLDDDEDFTEKAQPNPPISEAAIRGGTSVRYLSQNLYHTLHENWPCQLEGHEHGGKLGHCVEAKFCLDPQWSSRDPDPSRGSFFILLAGSDIIQECRIHWLPTNIVNNENTPACLVDHEASKDVCLQLTKDDNNRLWGLELGQPLEVLQLEEECAERSLESLRKLLEIVKPTYAAKRVLGLVLTRSLLHLLEGPWVNSYLSIDDIFVFCKVQNGYPCPLFDRVFLSTAFKAIDSESSPQASRRPPYSIHPFPTILALGIALAEMELGDELVDIYGQPSFAGLRNKPSRLAKKLWEECERRFHLGTGLMRAVKFCTDQTSFLRFADMGKETVFTDSEFVDAYYRKAIRPLEEDLVNGAKWTWDEVNWLKRRDLGDQGVCKIIKSKNYPPLNDSTHRIRNTEQKWSKSPGHASSLLAISEVNGSMEDFQQNPSSDITLLTNDRAQHCQPSSTPEPVRPKTRDGFDIAIICALPPEADAVLSAFDHHWDKDLYGKATNDPNFYSVGVMRGRNVVLVHPPRSGKAPAANVATACAMSFTKVTLALIVGVCGGVPYKHNKDVLLGDVVISKGVIQYDHGRQYSDGFKRKVEMEAALGRPNPQIGSVLAALETQFHRENAQHKITAFLDGLDEDVTSYPGDMEDRLFPSWYRHKHHNRQVCRVCADCCNSNDSVCDVSPELNCQVTGCEEIHIVKRRRQNQKNQPFVHVGLMASGDSVLKSAIHRDQIAENEDVIAFEMEGAGAWDALPCVVIKGVCDYADSHKNKLWQKYAAFTAAACAREFIQYCSLGTTQMAPIAK
ncbi:purine and uridine phosphorylase [Aspergillus eucalypticola CBS 122712]|uniref:Purine and uridine phosphorylase n=1 Tax=Aspergillus eucalypticola (strain CBS 122712 / IBT 29274) TaxID=1448314 RepID=A0A317WGF7_ASPEC|nr:purine and uridine phosphorylase [Aspergillus eucalypticola CBS 122712]PWY85556.1 purine and uridine phosphorylase [Aspergillus eucalypticola CBS 122712]